jgi:hypothetical protein
MGYPSLFVETQTVSEKKRKFGGSPPKRSPKCCGPAVQDTYAASSEQISIRFSRLIAEIYLLPAKHLTAYRKHFNTKSLYLHVLTDKLS